MLNVLISGSVRVLSRKGSVRQGHVGDWSAKPAAGLLAQFAKQRKDDPVAEEKAAAAEHLRKVQKTFEDDLAYFLSAGQTRQSR